MRWKSLLISIVISTLLTSCEQQPVFERNQTVYKIGDQEAWATKDYDDSEWTDRPQDVPDGQVYWFRTNIDILESPASLKPYGLQIEVYGEYEVFWDGVLIGKNGNPGKEAELGPKGELWVTYIIPAELTTQGEHTLAVRASLYYFSNHTGIFDLKIDDYDDLLTGRLIESSYIHIFAGSFLIASVYFLFLFLVNKRDYPTLIFSVSCFFVFTLSLIQFLGITIPIHYSQHHQRFALINTLTFGVAILIPLYFSLQFPLSRRKLLLTLGAVPTVLLFLLTGHSFSFTNYGLVISMWVFTTAIVVYGVFRQYKGAPLVLAVLVLCVLIRWLASLDLSLFIGFSLILLSMLYLLSIKSKEQRLAYEESLLESTRLQLELIKKNIQPHFLLNTLTSLIDWVEESPKKGVQFIEALAKEFDLFNQIQNEKLIPITQEIELCRTHMEIMEYRKEIQYHWEQEGIDPEEKIPPAIIHTLLENGITHSLPLDDNSIRFKLSYKANKETKRYTFMTFAKGINQQSTIKEGTGLKYIKARLSESYESNWELISEPSDHGWKSIIKIY